MSIQLLLSKRRHPGSALIRAVTWSRWSHVDIVRGPLLLSAAAPHGVGYYSLYDRLDLASAAVMVEVPVQNVRAAMDWAESQIGKPYDWLGVLGVGLHRDWQEDDAWFCSEFAMQTLRAGGYEPYRTKALRRVVPEHVWIMNLPSERVK